MIRERNRLNVELATLGLKEASRPFPLTRSFERQVPLAYETPDPFDEFRIRGGLYSAAEKARALGKNGLILTYSVIEKEERHIANKIPASIGMVSSDTARFANGKLGEWVVTYDEFTDYLEEVLRAIGRLRDLVSAGSPELPTDMTKLQKQTYRPSDDTAATSDRKTKYQLWTQLQRAYADAGGPNLTAPYSGLAFDVPKTRAEFIDRRQEFWHAQDDLKRVIAEAKRQGKPTADIELKFGDLLSVLSGGWDLAVTVADSVYQAYQKRKEYDEKIKQFEELMKHAKTEIRNAFETLKTSGDRYWRALKLYREVISKRNKTRSDSRAAAGLFGQSMVKKSSSSVVAASIRMPAIVADSWRILAIIGPEMRNKLHVLTGAGELIKDAGRPQLWRPDLYGSDITHILRAFRRSKFWAQVFTKEEVDEWRAANRLWAELFGRIDV
jgi:hypothetical protein